MRLTLFLICMAEYLFFFPGRIACWWHNTHHWHLLYTEKTRYCPRCGRQQFLFESLRKGEQWMDLN